MIFSQTTYITNNIFCFLPNVTQDYRPHVKLEISSFMGSVVLEVLAHPNSSFDHKMTALDIIVSMLRDHQLVVDIFLNYDADPAALDLFRATTHALQRAARTRFAQESWITAEQEAQIHVLALEGLNSTMRSLVVWSRDALAGPAAAAERALAASGLDADDVEALRALKHASAAGNPLDRDDGVYETVMPRRLDTPAGAAALAGVFGSSVTADAAGLIDPSPPGCAVHWPEAEARRALREQATSRKRNLDAGLAKFNAGFKKGIEFIFAHNLLERNPATVARCLFETPGVDKGEIGHYFGLNDPFAQAVVTEYAQLQDFSGLMLDDALRKFLQSFDLPRESQMIDRIMERYDR